MMYGIFIGLTSRYEERRQSLFFVQPGAPPSGDQVSLCDGQVDDRVAQGQGDIGENNNEDFDEPNLKFVTRAGISERHWNYRAGKRGGEAGGEEGKDCRGHRQSCADDPASLSRPSGKNDRYRPVDVLQFIFPSWNLVAIPQRIPQDTRLVRPEHDSR
jgi:hypothetical protein